MPVETSDSAARQFAKDLEYRAACAKYGVKPEMPSYRAASVEDELLDRFALEQDGANKNGSSYNVRRAEPLPLKDLPPEAAAVSRALDLLMPLKSDVASFVKTAGRRCLCMAWMLGKRPEPLAELARQLGCSRAALSTYVRNLEDLTGVHGRGQKGARTRDIYRDNARKSWKLRRLNSMMADATGEKKTPASAEPAGV
jgi:hypothetical protein